MSLRVDLDYEIHCLLAVGLWRLLQQNHIRLLLDLFGVGVVLFVVAVVADIVCALAVGSFSEN